jgi:hypothetical protein
MRAASLVASILFALPVHAQSCPRPEVPAAGFPTNVELVVPVTYSDGYQTFGSLIRPDGTAPSCGWPLVVYVHPLGQSRGFDLGWLDRLRLRLFFLLGRLQGRYDLVPRLARTADPEPALEHP